MENTQSSHLPVSGNHKSLTPHELIKRHSEHPDEPITDEDMNNMNLSDEVYTSESKTNTEDNIILSGKEEKQADELAGDLKKNNTGMSYQADL